MKHVSTVTRNLAASLIGGAWASALALLFIPAYLRFLGAEAYGLVGLYATLHAIFALFDLGLGATLSRGLARLSADPRSAPRQRDLLRTFELIYHAIALMLGGALFALAPAVARHWVQSQELPLHDVTTAIRLMGVLCTVQFPVALYQAGLLGLQRHVRLNAVIVAGSTLRAGGAVLVLMLVSRSVVAFFAWQAIVTLLQAAAMFGAIWSALGGARHARFDRRIPRAEWRLAAGLSASALAFAGITQAGRVILSGVAPLRELGYYTLAASVASAPWLFIVPVTAAVAPRFAQLLAARDTRVLTEVFHKACQTVAVLVLPVGVTLAAFPHAIVAAWTGDALAADRAGSVVPLLAAGTALWSLSSVPACLQYAAGWTRPMLYTSLIAGAVLVPSATYAVSRVGAPGAALVWLVAGAAYLLPAALTFRLVIGPDRRRWWVRDVGLPLAAAIAAGLVMRGLMPAALDRALTVGYLCLSAACVFAAVVALAPDVRAVAMGRWRPPMASGQAAHPDPL